MAAMQDAPDDVRTAKRKPGRPKGTSPYKTPELCAEICERLSSGETLTDICADEHMPARQKIYEWMEVDDVFSGRVARARSLGFDAIAEDALHIANTPVEGVIEKSDATGTTITREDMLGHRRLQVETRLKLLAKWDPKRYGERQIVQGDRDADPVQVSHKVDFSSLSAEERAAIQAILEARAPRVGGGSDDGQK